jgi:hypothetical protein
MTTPQASRTRLIVIILVALALLLAFVVATGSGTSGSSNPPPTVAPIVTSPPFQISAQQVRGKVTVRTMRAAAQSWRFTYYVRNTGPIPIAGFQINSNAADLFRVRQPRGWTAYGAGVCHGNYPGILIYWSTSASGLHTVPSNATRRFSFFVRTRGTKAVRYSLSWRSARPEFGKIVDPAPSSLPATARCNS